MMTRTLRFFTRAALCLCLGVAAVQAADSSLPEGKWTMKRVTDDGTTVVQKIVINESKLTFRMMSEGGSTIIYAEGRARVEKAGDIKVLMLDNIKAGPSESEAQLITETFQAPFRLGYNTLYLASGLDRERDDAPRMDVYKKE